MLKVAILRLLSSVRTGSFIIPLSSTLIVQRFSDFGGFDIKDLGIGNMIGNPAVRRLVGKAPDGWSIEGS
jgi:hypothetical protein